MLFYSNNREEDPILPLNKRSKSRNFSLCYAATQYLAKSLTITHSGARKPWHYLGFPLCNFLETWNNSPFLKIIVPESVNLGEDTFYARNLLLTSWSCHQKFSPSLFDMNWSNIALLSIENTTSVPCITPLDCLNLPSYKWFSDNSIYTL